MVIAYEIFTSLYDGSCTSSAGSSTAGRIPGCIRGFDLL